MFCTGVNPKPRPSMRTDFETPAPFRHNHHVETSGKAPATPPDPLESVRRKFSSNNEGTPPHQTTRAIQVAANTAAACQSAFAYFSGNCEK